MVRSTGDSWFSPSMRISGRRLMPLTNRVISTKAVVATAMNWRASSGTPVCSVTASASASDTAPRSPPHSITTL